MELQPSEWKDFLLNDPDAHLLQTLEWGNLKSTFGWKTAWLAASSGMKIGAQILLRRFFPGFTMAYIPKGPVYDLAQNSGIPAWNLFWGEVDQFCRSRRIAFLKVEPDLWIQREEMNPQASVSSSQTRPTARFIPEAKTPPKGFIQSDHAIQPLRTIVLSLSADEETLLAQMKQKTRYNIKLALRHEVHVKPSSDINAFYHLMTVTGSRDRFGIHSLDYYRTAYELFHARSACQLLIAEQQGDILAGLIVFKNGSRAWYLYGASNNQKRELMPTYLLQWEAIRWARAQGCLEYDLWGVPDFDLNDLEAQFTHRQDQLWGVYRFKRGFGGELRRAAGAWDRVYNPLLYAFYRWWISRRSNPTAASL